ncbi:TPA: aldo/keto reductase [Klebsiella pneumoniae]|uniref:aldo/keto reductase n=1 Tax=Klebsiella pneumoniae TaxID=573 RepID=UPI001D0F3F4E|nr:aldo/keto reductase [Klebsiella pneumoniae]MCM5766021.1 aldo/keto reductase [Klebsiella pneumoniae]MDR4647893.1 aldo/keto reductase [Klebsiella pneumoniae]MDS6700260.1 aldo/keto reductase [Klebsiella pneumoniae]
MNHFHKSLPPATQKTGEINSLIQRKYTSNNPFSALIWWKSSVRQASFYSESVSKDISSTAATLKHYRKGNSMVRDPGSYSSMETSINRLTRRRFIQTAAMLLSATALPRVQAFDQPIPKSHALDEYLVLGQSGLRVSPFALGCMTFGEDLGWGASVGDSEQVLDRYLALGGNFIDTANGYTKGHSEKIIGDYLARNPGRRDRLVIGTKFATNLYPGDPNGGGTSRKATIDACNESLRRLRTDYIDLYWMHHWDSNTPVEETMSALNDLVRAGKVRYLGVSDTPAWVATQAQMIAITRGWAPFIATQIEYSLAERSSEAELLPMATAMGMGVIPWAPLAAGRISGKYTRQNGAQAEGGRAALMGPRVTEKHLQIVDALTEAALELNTTIPRVALSWLQNRNAVTTTILGARLPEHLEDNVQALALELPTEITDSLEKLTTPELPFPIEFLNQNAKALHQGSTTVNGVSTRLHPYGPRNQKDHY